MSEPTTGASPASGVTPPFNHPSALLVLPRGDGALVVVDVDEYAGWPRLGIRLWILDSVTGWRPTRSGFSIAPRDVPAFTDAVRRAGAAVLERDAKIMETRRAREVAGHERHSGGGR